MLQILIWAACAIIIGIGYCGWRLEEIVAIQKKGKPTVQGVFLILMIILAVMLFALSLSQGSALSGILNR